LRSGAPHRIVLAVAAALCAAALAGCGLGAGEQAGGTQLLVTKDFGARGLVQTDAPKTEGSDTVMRLLQRNAEKVETRYGGGFVQSIDGTAGGQRDGRPVDWFYYVNGSQAEKGAASTRVRSGDRIWWDFHDWGSGETRAVVGQFPEPFVHGLDGRRLPTRVECIDPKAPECSTVADALVSLDVPAAKGGLARSLVKETLRVIVGPWQAIRADAAAAQLERGPEKSGVYARPAADGRSIALLDGRGEVTRTLGPGAGLVAATTLDQNAPVWIVTGTDPAGIRAAASVLDEGALAGRFAVAVDGGGRPIPLPERR
jgi:hypothetical protein